MLLAAVVGAMINAPITTASTRIDSNGYSYKVQHSTCESGAIQFHQTINSLAC